MEENNNIKVIKRDGSKEDFDKEKLFKVAKATGLNHIQSKKVTENTAKWVTKQNKDSISSLLIRKKFYREILKNDEYSASLYAWYQKLKDKSYLPRLKHTKYK